MEVRLRNNRKVFIREYDDRDFHLIQALNKREGWTNLAVNSERTKIAWEHSNVAIVAETENDEIAGFIRGLTDTAISIYICELLIDKKFRGLGLGETLLCYVQQLYPNARIDLLATRTSRSFYEKLGFRHFAGFRRTKG